MLFAENMGHFGFKNLRIRATDLDDSSQFGGIIRTGLYEEAEVKRMPKELKRGADQKIFSLKKCFPYNLQVSRPRRKGKCSKT